MVRDPDNDWQRAVSLEPIILFGQALTRRQRTCCVARANTGPPFESERAIRGAHRGPEKEEIEPAIPSIF
jgi:hypothetical protein